MLHLIMMMMMQWEPVCHKTESQRHCELRNCSSRSSIHSSPSYQPGKNMWGEGNGWLTGQLDQSHLGSHLPANHSCNKTEYTNFHTIILLLVKTNFLWPTTQLKGGPSGFNLFSLPFSGGWLMDCRDTHKDLQGCTNLTVRNRAHPVQCFKF